MKQKAATPAQIHELFGEYFRAAELDNLMSLYAEDAVLVPQPGEVVRGHEAIRSALLVFLELRGRFEMPVGRVVLSEDTALLISPWTLEGGVDPAGNNVNLKAFTADVAKRQSDGSWLLVIDNPWGATGLEHEKLSLGRQ